ncbi:hypothetical protein C7212DRAFT_366086 [Tuber magnatum]|uniref:Uncharacterized protein n=1 Tax=Tuber magnatum TaxID=42249 RepID=A0A317SHS5_9PEZI|nr:hypothetical protein C7212DRAFT_366086 [Tuber magnatum]
MVRPAITNSAKSSSRRSSGNGWTTIPVKPKPLVSFPKVPAKPTLHMLLLHSYFPLNANKWIWHCYLDAENLSLNPRGGERYMRIQKAFTKSGTFFAERGIVLHSLNISTSRIVELFFGSEEDLWKADALVEEYSRAMTGADGYIRRKENIGKMVCHGVCFLKELAHEFDSKWDLKEAKLRELEDLNPVFDSHGKRVLYRIRCAHYMSSRAPKEKLLRTGATWVVTFSDFRVAECFIDWHVEFNFFTDPCTGGLRWYQEDPPRSFPKPNGSGRGSGSSNNSGSVPGAIESSGAPATPTASGANKRIDETPEGLVLTKNPKQAKRTLNGRVSITEQKKPEDRNLTKLFEQVETLTAAKTTNTKQQGPETQAIATAPTDGVKQVVGEESEVQLATNASKKTGSPANIKATSAGQQRSEILSIVTTPTNGVEKAVVAKKPEAQVPTNSFTKQATSTATCLGNVGVCTAAAAAVATNDVGAFRGGVTAASVDTSQLKVEKMCPPGVNEKRKQAKLANKKRKMERKKADKKAAPGSAAGGGEGGGAGGEAKVKGKGVEHGIITG